MNHHIFQPLREGLDAPSHEVAQLGMHPIGMPAGQMEDTHVRKMERDTV